MHMLNFQKWSVDPRNSAWSKDESKFGQKILEKMGWSKGKGLGVQEQGSTEHIKVQVKNNTLGLGAAINYEDNWIAHQDDFNQLLAELNNCHRQEPSSEQKKTFSLEEKSRSSRKRVHYMKFAKGKDLSSRSEDDLSCIFGKRQNTKTEVNHMNVGLERTPSNTVTSTMTVQEYFAKRMAKLKKFQKEPESELADPGTTAAEDLESSQGLKTRSKKKSRKNAEAENVDSYEEPKVKRSRTDGLWEEELEIANTEYQPRKKKKKAKDPHKGEDVSCDGNSCVFPGSGEICLGTSDRENLGEKDSKIKQKKPYKKKHKKQKKEAPEYVNGMQRKKKKHLS
uniref:PIN2 (TERF1) interacting telomerase inhibitor 1 n=1 Tax=Chelonoidis abingdonii TaxID=106734 RepID=A0A8C0GXJ9_CHEAB